MLHVTQRRHFYSAGRVARGVLARALFVAVGAASQVTAQDTCPRADLPAYAHNDYNNPKPLFDALRLGYQGAEADVFLVDGQLRVAHDRRQASRSGTLEQLYLQPLQELAQRCGFLVPERKPFILNVEIKEASRATFDSLLALVTRYREVLSYAVSESSRVRVAVVTLVGWHPPLDQLSHSQLSSVRFQHKLTRPDEPIPRGEDRRYAWMASVDYGKSIGGWRASSRRREQWFARLRELGDSLAVRVYNVPRDSVVYRRLLASRVDLIGTETLAPTRELLLPLVSLSRCYAIEAGPWVIPDTAHGDVDEIPNVVMRDTSHMEFLFQDSDWRRLIAFRPGGARSRMDWMWLSRIGFFSITNSNGYGGVGLEFRIAGDSIYGKAEMFSDAIGPKYPHAAAWGRAVACP